MTRVLLLAVILGTCEQSYSHYRDIDHYFSGYWMPFIHGSGAAPEQYRIGIKMIAWWLVQHLSWSFHLGFALIDVITSAAGALLVYDLLLHRPAIRMSNTAMQWFASAGFVLLMCYYMMWVNSFFRPETMPCIGLTACMAWLWTCPRHERSGAVLTICGLLAVTVALAWIRADIPCAFSAGIFVASLAQAGRGLSISRTAAQATSAGCFLVAAGTQLYIMRVLYPQASYGKVPVLMATRDLRDPLVFPPFLIFIVPLVWTAVQAYRQRSVLDTGSRGLLLGAIIYFVLWVLLGKLDEVRIFIPFAVVLIPITMELAVRRISFGVWTNGRGVEV